MSVKRVFLVTQESLVVWLRNGRSLKRAIQFPGSDEGFSQFDTYLQNQPDQPSLMLMDVIEEEFARETVPKLGSRDRKELIARRLRRKFPRTPYRLSCFHGKKAGTSDEYTVVHCAISNHELLDPWLKVVKHYRTPLTGIFSVPLLAADLLHRIAKSQDAVLLLTQHHQLKLRQVFLRSGNVQSARLSQSPEQTNDDYAEFVVTEILRGRRYLERSRLLTSAEVLDVCMVADKELADRVTRSASTSSPMRLHFIDPDIAANRVGIDGSISTNQLEALFVASCLRKRPRHDYAVSGETRYSGMHSLRHSLFVLALAATVVCSVFSGIYLAKAWQLRGRTAEIEAQILQLSDTFKRENEQFQPINVSSLEMKVAVDTGDYLLGNRLPVPWVMQQIGVVMGGFPNIQVDQLSWAAESSVLTENARPPPQRNDISVPVVIPPIAEVKVELNARIRHYDGNIRRAFGHIDSLVAALESQTSFSEVVAVEYPLDARPQSSISGEILSSKQIETATFRLRLVYRLQTTADATSGNVNETI